MDDRGRMDLRGAERAPRARRRRHRRRDARHDRRRLRRSAARHPRAAREATASASTPTRRTAATSGSPTTWTRRRAPPSTGWPKSTRSSIDPHKHGLQPYGCGCVLFRDPAVGRALPARLALHLLQLGRAAPGRDQPGVLAPRRRRRWRSGPRSACSRSVPGGEFAPAWLQDCRAAALRLARRAVAHDARFVPGLAPELDIVVWAPRAERPRARRPRGHGASSRPRRAGTCTWRSRSCRSASSRARRPAWRWIGRRSRRCARC